MVYFSDSQDYCINNTEQIGGMLQIGTFFPSEKT